MNKNISEKKLEEIKEVLKKLNEDKQLKEIFDFISTECPVDHGLEMVKHCTKTTCSDCWLNALDMKED